jgi:hypothetical protein
MPDITIGSLRLEIADAAGHEHRAHDIALRATKIFATRLGEKCREAAGLPRAVCLDAIMAPALNLDLNRTSDEQAAGQIAGAWLEALAPHLGGGRWPR